MDKTNTLSAITNSVMEALKKRCEIGSNLTIETSKQRYWRLSGMFIVNFKHILFLVLVFLMLTINK